MKILKGLLIGYLSIGCIQFALAQYKSARLSVPFKKNWTKKNVNAGNWIDVVTYLPKGYVKDGSMDYTLYVQRALDRNSRVIMPNFPISVTGIFANSGQEILFQGKSQLMLLPTANSRYEVLAIHGAKNVSIYNANIKGDLDKHKGTDGEWGYGIGIRSSQNVRIYNATISNCWGDGLVVAQGGYYFRKGAKTLPTSDIYVDGISIDYTRRNGITIGNGENVAIKNAIISNVFGIAPKAGVDIEPDLSNHGKLENIKFENIKIFNTQSGFAALLDLFIDARNNNIANVSIDGLQVRNAQSGLHLSGYSKKGGAKKLGGLIKLTNFKSEAVEIPVRIREGSQYFPKMEIKNYSINTGGKVYENNPTKLLEKTKTDRNLLNIK